MILEVLAKHISLALVSASLATLLGFVAATGLIYFRQNRKPLSILILLPTWIPPLFVAMSAHHIWKGALPLGFWTVAMVQALMNVGLVALGLSEVIEGKVSRLAQVSQTLGLSKFQFWKTSAKGLTSEIYILFVLVLGLCFFSLSIPLLLGGGEILTLEILALRQLRMYSDFRAVFGLAGIQLLIFVGFAWWTKLKPQIGRRQFLPQDSCFPFGILLALIPVSLMLLGLAKGAATSFGALKTPYVKALIEVSLAPTFFVGLGVGLLTFVFGMLFYYFSDSKPFVKAMNNYLTPSSLLIAILFWFVPGLNTMPAILKIVVAVSIATFPLVYRVFGQQHTSETNWQWKMGSILSGRKNLIYYRVILPGSFRVLLHLSALASVWAVGDFALSSFVSSRDLTLAMNIHDLAGNYRIKEATALIWVLVPVGAICYIIFLMGLYGEQKYENRKS